MKWKKTVRILSQISIFIAKQADMIETEIENEKKKNSEISKETDALQREVNKYGYWIIKVLGLGKCLAMSPKIPFKTGDKLGGILLIL